MFNYFPTKYFKSRICNAFSKKELKYVFEIYLMITFAGGELLQGPAGRPSNDQF